MRKLKIIILSIVAIFVIGITSNFSLSADTVLEPLVIDGVNVKYFETSDNVMIPTTYSEKTTEFRGVWVATVWNIDFPQHASEAQYKAEFNDLITEMIQNNMNAMVFQVRSQNDAWFESDYAPWSRWLTGTEGVDPGWDVMSWMIATCHANGIEFHAWLNPYRVANTSLNPTSYLSGLHADNWAKLNPAMVLFADTYVSNGTTINPIILNPGEPAVKQYIRDVIVEIITDYDVDGVHFDDYFYPSSGLSTDTTTYNTYKETGQTLADWRRENVNEVIEGIKADVDAYNLSSGESVKFGVSPSGVWASDQQIAGGSNTHPAAHDSYFTQYADTKKWVEEGWLHYICPQIYRDFEHDLIPYADIVDWWAGVARGTGVDLIVGHALYMTYFDDDEVSTQFLYNQKHPEIKGSLMYSAKWMNDNRFQNAVTDRWTTTPSAVWESSGVSGPSVSIAGTLSENVYITDVVVTLTADDDIYYKLDADTTWNLYTTPINITGAAGHVLYMKTINGLGEESLISSRNIPISYRNPDVPTITITGDQIGDNYLLDSTLTITSGGTDIYVAINHGTVGAFELYTGPITLDDLGGYYIQAKTIDSNGTESTITIESITIQASCYDDPTMDITGTGIYPYFQNATVTLSGNAPSILYKLNDDSFITYTSPFELSTEGEFTIIIKNDDECAVEITDTITIDTTPPTNATMAITGDYDGEKYYTSITSVDLTITEANSTILYRVHNGKTWSQWETYGGAIEFLFTANYYLQYKTIDQAGNESDFIEERIRLDLPASENNMYVVRDGSAVTYYDTSTLVELPTTWTEQTEEIRGIWVATVANIDLKQYTTEADYKATIIHMLSVLEMNNFNTVFFQVRPMNDAWYDSDYAPWSRYLTGTEGEDPGWDVFGFFIEEAHKRGIEVHAWLNPYRVSTGTGDKASQLASLHDENWAKQNPDMVIQDNAGKLILNPGERQVQVYIRNVIQELMTKYDVDGIHFDDYFYSYNGTPDSADADLYNTKKEPGQTIHDWRRENINTVVREVFEAVELYNLNNNATIEFGISPFGIWDSGGEEGSNTSPYALSSYEDQYADSKRWVEEGWVHYILPQLYWEFDHSAAPFADLVDWWQALCEENDVDLIIGHGFYRYDDDSWDDPNELLEQLRYISQYDSIIGSTFFTFNTLLSTDTEVLQAIERLNNYYWTTYATFPWESDVVKQEDPVCLDDQTLIDGECVDNPPVCETDQTLINGECIDNPPVCEDDQTLTDGECIDNPPVCEDGYAVVDGECQAVFKKTGCFSSVGFGNSLAISITALFAGLFLILKRRH